MSDLPSSPTSTASTHANLPLVAIYWLIVGIPLCWGVYQTVQKSIPLFHVTASGPTTTPPR